MLFLVALIFVYVNSEDFTFLKGQFGGFEPYATYGSSFASGNVPGGRKGGILRTLSTHPDSIFLLLGLGHTTSGGSGKLDDVWEYSVSLNQWRMVRGTQSINPPQNVTDPGDFHSFNTPGGYLNAAAFSTYDEQGFIVEQGITTVFTNEMWIFNVTRKQWKRIYDNGIHVKGTTGEFDPANRPPRTYNNVFSQSYDINNTFGIKFGGFGKTDGSAFTDEGYLNDVWMINKETLEWSHRYGCVPTSDCTENIVGEIGEYHASNQMRSSYEQTQWIIQDENSPSMFVFGGVYFNSDTVDRNDLWEYDINTNLWRVWIEHTGVETSDVDYQFGPSNVPGPGRMNTAGFGLGSQAGQLDYLYVFGGYTYNYGDVSGSLWVYSRELNQWKFEHGGRDGYALYSDTTNGVIGSSRYGAATILNNKVYIWNGQTWNDDNELVYSNMLWRYDGFNCYDHHYANDPQVCSAHGSCLGPDTCYCEFQYTTTPNCTTFALDTDDYFTLEKGPITTDGEAVYTCDDPSALISSRSRGAGFYFRNHKILLFGGERNRNNETNDIVYLNDVWSYSTTTKNYCFLKGNQTGEVEQSTSMELLSYDPLNTPSSRSSFGSFSTYFSFLIFGGSSTGGILNNDLWEFSVVSGTNRHQWRQLMENSDSDNYDMDHPKKRKGHCVAQVQENSNLVYSFGGQIRNDSSYAYMNDLWIYNVQQNTFTKIRNESQETMFSLLEGYYVSEHYTPHVVFSNDTNPPVRSFCSCWVEKRSETEHLLYIFGGEFPNKLSTNDVWMFNSSMSSWMFIAGGKNNSKTSVYDFEAGQEGYYQYDVVNLPSTRSGMISFSNQAAFFSENVFVFFGGGDYGEALIWGDMWAFSNSLWQFKFLNGTLGYANVECNVDMIGSRRSGVGVTLPSRKLMIFGGESL